MSGHLHAGLTPCVTTAQMEDMVRNHGFVFRPYSNYNYPIYYSYLTMPLYFLAGGVGVKLFNFLFVGVLAVVTYGLVEPPESADH